MTTIGHMYNCRQLIGSLLQIVMVASNTNSYRLLVYTTLLATKTRDSLLFTSEQGSDRFARHFARVFHICLGAGYSLAWYILKQLFTLVSVNNNELKKIKAWVLFYFTKKLGGGPSFED